MTNAPDGAFTPDEVAAILEMTDWATAYRDLHWSIPAMPWPHDRLAGLPVERTNFPGQLDLIGRRSMFEGECVLCTLHRTPDGPRVEGITSRDQSTPRGARDGRSDGAGSGIPSTRGPSGVRYRVHRTHGSPSIDRRPMRSSRPGKLVRSTGSPARRSCGHGIAGIDQCKSR